VPAVAKRGDESRGQLARGLRGSAALWGGYATELAGYTSSQYIWRYVRPTDGQKEAAREGLF